MNDAPQAAVPLVVGQRAWTRPLGPGGRSKHRKTRQVAPPSDWVFIFDTETTVDAAQQFRVGCFRILDGTRLVQEGLFYEHVTPAELVLLEQVRRDSGIALLSIKEFRNWFFHYVYRLRATVVGHNLPFDLSRLAVDWAAARKGRNGSEKFKGGFSFVLWPRKDEPGENTYRPRLRIKALNRRAALIEFADVPKEARGPDGFWPGRFVDTHTLAAALTDKSLTLNQAAETFGTAHRKLGDVRHGEPLKREYIEYVRRDVLVTEEVYFNLTAEFTRHPIDLDASKAYSSASIGKAYLQAMGITPPSDRSSAPDEVLGYSMSAFYGGRVECRVRHEIVPVTYLDVRSMYPTVFCLLGLQRLLIAEQIDSVDATDEIRNLIASAGPDQLFDQATWLDLCAVCEVEPDGGDVFPIRAEYGAASSRSIGLNYLDSDQPMWFSLPDVIAAKVLTGRAPKIRRAYRFKPSGLLDSLRPVRLRSEVVIDPRINEIFKLVIEERVRIGDLSEAGISASERFLKVFANSTSYGIFAELNRQERSRQSKQVEVFAGHRFEAPVHAIEKPGLYCFPPLAMLITGAARLILALAEREVTSRGGTYAFCDTDSIAILTDYGELEDAQTRRAFCIRADLLRLDQIEEIVGRFDQLSPFSISGSILKYEPENFGEDSEDRAPLYAYAVSAKRYVLMNVGRDGSLKVRRFSEHGLGTYTDPSDDG